MKFVSGLGYAKEVYEWPWYEIGQSKLVRGRNSKTAHAALSIARKRHPELRERIFQCVTVFNGVVVRRVK